MILIFTKFDSLVSEAYGLLRTEGKKIPDAQSKKEEKAQILFKDDYINAFKEIPPYLQLGSEPKYLCILFNA